MKRTKDRLQQAIDLLKEYKALMSCGVVVPDHLVRQAHCELPRALVGTRQVALKQRRQRRKNAA